MLGGLLKLVRQIFFFSDSSFEVAMDGWMDGWWRGVCGGGVKFYVKFFFESFVVKGVCFFLLMICLIAFKNETKRNPNYGKMNGLDPEMWWSRVSFSW